MSERFAWFLAAVLGFATLAWAIITPGDQILASACGSLTGGYFLFELITDA